MNPLLKSHLLAFFLFLSASSSDPYVLREAHVYGSLSVGLASGLASLVGLASKLTMFKRGLSPGMASSAPALMILAYPTALLGLPGFFAYLMLTNVAFAIILVLSLTVVAEEAPPNKLGFHYALRGIALSAASFLGPLVGGLAYSALGLPGSLAVGAAASAVTFAIQRTLMGYSFKGGGGWSFSPSWALAYATSFFLASTVLIISTYLPPYQASRGSGYLATTYFFSGRALGSGSTRVLGGIIADAAPRLIAVPPLLALAASRLALNALEPSAAAVAGFFTGGSWGLASPTLLSIAAREKEKGKSMSLFTTAWDLANVTSVPLAGAAGSFEASLSLSTATASMALVSAALLAASRKINPGRG
ncbi:MFS transporter [Ignicoccus hospitalis]|uniref:Uncharacterized protein n=1 Tax=Ignicoccus hospitalis (strain KIN4/I / DSM 18386 / JCM 14125) TaxID=453591 RepID=A8A979_IGNH4|nr:MFS transporter [Ignicoccus hospitalis]ABU81481.1 hypothetical protein Igni_0298 [Ignicoccus hospitalis KIN4/I]HIH90211.1 MFS transporter [Desulfurococcaceae archaeon]